MPQVRKPAVAGMFYPSNPDELERVVNHMLDRADAFNFSGKPVGLIAPHAGYVYSGQVAAQAYSLLRGREYDCAIVIGPSHRAHTKWSALMSSGGYRTPLGEMPVDTDLALDIMEASSTVRSDEDIHDTAYGEHSVEVQLPFLQVALQTDLPIVPIIMGDPTPEVSRDLGEAIAYATEELNCIVVASSDLSHFYDDDTARKIDAHIYEAVRDFDINKFWKNLQERRAEACGSGPMAAVMHASRGLGAEKSLPLQYATYADVPQGDRGRVVGYMSAAFVVGEETHG